MVSGVVLVFVVVSICVRCGCMGILVMVCLCFVIWLFVFNVFSCFNSVVVLFNVVGGGGVRNGRLVVF